jgi:hypothetical protein
MAEAIEISGANPEARPREKLRSLVQLLLHHAKCKLSPSLSLSLSLSLVVQMWARENTVAASAFRAPPPFSYPIFENLNDFRVYKSWRELIFFLFFRGEISQSFGIKFSNNKYSFAIFCL